MIVAAVEHAVPYLSVVVATRNDDHGGDPLARLQAFVNCFDAQCRRTGLDAEVIIVEWNPPPDRPRLQSLVRWPTPCVCTYRFVCVPPELHNTLEYADVLPLFQMIAKNVGIRRARGRFVLATNIDIIFSDELVAYLASGQLEAGHLYRVDRHDIEAALPLNAPLDVQMAYCAQHQLRIHGRWGSYAVDGVGHPLPNPEDIVDGKTVRLGSGWHMREGTSTTGFYRWATDRAVVHIVRSGDSMFTPAVLEIETQANPYAPSSWVDLEIADESGAVLVGHRLAGRRIWRLPLERGAASRTLALRVVGAPPESRRDLAVFECRDAMYYQVHSIRVTNEDVGAGQRSLVYPARHWRAVAGASAEFGALDTVSVRTSPKRNGHAVEYARIRAPRTGSHRFTLTYEVAEGGVAIGALDARSGRWLPAAVDHVLTPRGHVATLTLEIKAGTVFSLMLSNDHIDGDGVSCFIIKEFAGSLDPADVLNARSRDGLVPLAAVESESGVTGLRRRVSGMALWLASRAIPASALRLVDRARASLVRRSPEYGALLTVRQSLERELARISEFGELAHLHKLMRDYRPDSLHLNACGDFQLMAREHWFELRGYPEFETFSMNIDGLFSNIAHGASISERALESPYHIYHLEHEVGSGWTPEGGAVLRRRIAERGITWLDSRDVFVLSTYMHWLKGSMIFNESRWGFGTAELEESIIEPRPRAMRPRTEQAGG